MRVKTSENKQKHEFNVKTAHKKIYKILHDRPPRANKKTPFGGA